MTYSETALRCATQIISSDQVPYTGATLDDIGEATILLAEKFRTWLLQINGYHSSGTKR